MLGYVQLTQLKKSPIITLLQNKNHVRSNLWPGQNFNWRWQWFSMGGFIHEAGIVDADYQQKNKIFYEQYEMGKQDNIAFLKFCL